MGMFDYMKVHPDITKELELTCHVCNALATDSCWQTKDIDRYGSGTMDTYYLSYDEDNKIVLYEVSPVSQDYFVPYTQQEIDEWNNKDDGSFFSRLCKRLPGDGTYKKEGYKIENRDLTPMGEEFHKWFNFYDYCEGCGTTDPDDFIADKTWIEFSIQFTDGIVTKVKRIEKNNG